MQTSVTDNGVIYRGLDAGRAMTSAMTAFRSRLPGPADALHASDRGMAVLVGIDRVAQASPSKMSNLMQTEEGGAPSANQQSRRMTRSSSRAGKNCPRGRQTVGLPPVFRNAQCLRNVQKPIDRPHRFSGSLPARLRPTGLAEAPGSPWRLRLLDLL